MTNQERNESFICRSIREPPGALYDIGVGPKSEWRTLGKRYPSMRVFGCEPNPVLHERIRTAGFPGPLWQVAIGQGDRAAKLHVPKGDGKVGSLFALPDADAVYDVNVWTLDEFDEHADRPARILLWMDIEGSELAALRSGQQLLASGRVRWINVEERRNGDCPAAGWCDPHDVHSLLIENGYERVAEYARYQTHQDVIYVHSDELHEGDRRCP